MPKTENLFAKLPPQIAHILEYAMLIYVDFLNGKIITVSLGIPSGQSVNQYKYSMDHHTMFK